MISARNSVVFAEAEQAKRKFRPVILILIFILLFFIYNSLTSIVIGPVMGVSLLTSDAYKELVNNFAATGRLDLDAMMGLVNSMPASVVLVQLYAFAFSYLVFFFFLKKIEKRSLASAGFVKKNALMRYLAGYLLGAVIMVISGLICMVTGNGSFSLNDNINIPMILLFFLGFIIQGAGEEIMCRGFLMVSMRNSLQNNKHKDIWIVVISSLVFGILHGTNPGMTLLSLINLILAGVFFAVLFIRCDNIWICCGAHSAWNFFQGQILGAQVSGLQGNNSILLFDGAGSTTVNGGSFGFEGGLAVTIVEVVTILVLIFLPSKRKAE